MAGSEASIEQLHAEARARPQDPVVWLSLAKALGAQRETKRAMKALRHAHALAAQAQRADLLVQAAHQYENLGDLAEGLNAVRLAAQLDSNLIEAIETIGRLLISLGDAEAATLSLRVALSQHPNTPSLHLRLAEAYLVAGRVRDAQRHGEKASEAGADTAETQRLLAKVYQRSGQTEEYLKALAKVVRLRPDDLSVAIELGRRLAEQGRRQESVSILMDVATRAPSVAEIQLQLGQALTEAHALAPAVRALREAIRINPDLAQAHLQLGRALRKAGATKDAISSFQTASSIETKNADILFELGTALREAGDLRQASTVLVKAAANAADNEEIQDALAQTLAELKQGPAPPKTQSEPGIDFGGRDTSESGFTGDLAMFSLPELLEFLLNQNATGELSIRSPTGIGTFEIYQGSVASATRPGGKRLSQILIDQELVTMTNLKQTVGSDDALSRDSTVATALVTSNTIDRNSVFELVSREVMEAIKEMVDWKEGFAAFRRLDPADEAPEILVDTRWALLEAMRELDEGK